MMNIRLWSVLSVLALFVVGCRDEDRHDPAPGPDVIWARWDPTAGVMPTPTDLVYDEELGRLNIAVDDDASGAEREFTQYLNRLDGYPLSTTIRFPLSAPINEATLLGSVFLLESPDFERLATRSYYDDEHKALIVEPRQPLKPGRTYIAALLGYDKGVRGQRGETVVSDGAFYLLKSPHSLRDHGDAFPASSRAEQQEMAQRMAEIQEGFDVAIGELERRGISAGDIAVMTQFATTNRPAILFDSVAGKVPMPNDLLFDEATQTVELPIGDDLDAEERAIREALSEYDGFSLSGAVVAESTHDFTEPADATGMRLFERLDDGRWREVVDVERGRFDDGRSVWIGPALALEPGRQYAYLLTDGLTSSAGQGHVAQPLGAMLRLSSPLFQEGRSLLSTISAAQAERLEPLRVTIDTLLDQLEREEGFSRHQVAAAVPFRTLRTMEPMLERRAALYEKNVSTAITNVETTDPAGALGLLIHDVETIVRGEMTTLDYLDPTTRAFYEDGHAEERSIKFVLTLPDEVDVTRPIPVVLFGHGLATSRELLYLIAGPLAKAGYAAFAMDLPYHGDRSVCRTDQSCSGDSRCEDDGQCRHLDGSKGQIHSINVAYLLPALSGTIFDQLLNYPATSGEVFIDINHIVATRDHFAQAFVDLHQALRLLRSDEFNQAIIDETGLWLDQDDIMYLGMSLGGILGAGLSALEPHLDDFVLNVPAVHLTRVIEHSTSFTTVFDQALHERGIERDSDAYFHFINALRWLLDPVDPLNLVQHATAQPYSYVDPVDGGVTDDRQARLLLQMALGDRVVPNEGTFALSQRSGVAITEYAPSLTDHGFLFDPNPFAMNSRKAREDLVEFFNER